MTSEDKRKKILSIISENEKIINYDPSALFDILERAVKETKLSYNDVKQIYKSETE